MFKVVNVDTTHQEFKVMNELCTDKNRLPDIKQINSSDYSIKPKTGTIMEAKLARTVPMPLHHEYAFFRKNNTNDRSKN
jgi:hypothetical protein